MKVYVIMQYAGPRPQPGTPIEIFFDEEDAEYYAQMWDDSKMKHIDECFKVESFNLTR